jgi:hypothetical protein
VKSLFFGVLAIELPASVDRLLYSANYHPECHKIYEILHCFIAKVGTVGIEPTSLSPKDVNLPKIPIKDKG